MSVMCLLQSHGPPHVSIPGIFSLPVAPCKLNKCLTGFGRICRIGGHLPQITNNKKLYLLNSILKVIIVLFY